MARICVDITKPDAGLLAPAQPLHPYAQPPQAVELKDELKMLVLSGDVDALDAKLESWAGWVSGAKKVFHSVTSASTKGINAAHAAVGKATGNTLTILNAAKAVTVSAKRQLDMAKDALVGKEGLELRAAELVVEEREEALAAAQAKEEAAREANKARAETASELHVEAMAQALRELCLLGRADAGTAPRQLVGIEAEIEAYKQHAAHAQQMQAMAAAVYPGQAPAVYPGQVLASPAVYPGQVLASPAVFQANPQWMRYVGC